MIIKNTGIFKSVRMNGIIRKINPGTTVVEDSKEWLDVVRRHPDLSIVTIQEAVKNDAPGTTTTTTAAPKVYIKKHYKQTTTTTSAPGAKNADTV